MGDGRCHTGKTVLYDTVTRLGWSSSDLRTHRIAVVIELLSKDWEEGGRAVPEAQPEEDCVASNKEQTAAHLSELTSRCLFGFDRNATHGSFKDEAV